MLDRIRECMIRAMGLDRATASRITEATTAAQLPAWTSVTHLALVLELERTFGVTFENEEVVTLGSVEAIVERLSAKGVLPEARR